MKKSITLLLVMFIPGTYGFGQALKQKEDVILFHGLILDAVSEKPVPQTQIFINRAFTAISNSDGKFGFLVNRMDTVVFRSLGYKPVIMCISDTLRGNEFLAGVFMNSDTLAIGEVVIMPRISSLKSDLLRPSSSDNAMVDNAKYNLAVSAYQGRVTTSRLGDPAMNYELLRQQQKYNAYSKGQIPPDKIIGLSPLMLIPVTYLLLNGLPEKPSAIKPVISDQEVEMILRSYYKTLRNK